MALFWFLPVDILQEEIAGEQQLRSWMTSGHQVQSSAVLPVLILVSLDIGQGCITPTDEGLPVSVLPYILPRR